MKTFGQVKIGDKVYVIDDDYRIREIYVCGVEDVRLAHKKVIIKTLNGNTYTADNNATKVTTSGGLSLFSCVESAQLERSKLKDIYAAKQFRLAMQAFRRMKKVIPNVEEQRKRVLLFFQILEANEE